MIEKLSHPKARDNAIKTFDHWSAVTTKEEAFDHAIAAYLTARQISVLPASAPTPAHSGDEIPEKAEAAIRKLKALKRDFNMKGANATTIERAIDLVRGVSRKVVPAHSGEAEGNAAAQIERLAILRNLGDNHGGEREAAPDQSSVDAAEAAALAAIEERQS